jgi:hypothetical protein
MKALPTRAPKPSTRVGGNAALEDSAASLCLLKTSFTISADLYEAARLRAGMIGYKSYAEYVNGLIRADIALKQSHQIGLSIRKLKARDRDSVDRELLARARQQKGGTAA